VTMMAYRCGGHPFGCWVPVMYMPLPIGMLLCCSIEPGAAVVPAWDTTLRQLVELLNSAAMKSAQHCGS
jgi:hypothetical protein